MQACVSSISALWRQCKRFHQNSEMDTFSLLSEQDEPDPDEHGMGQECPTNGIAVSIVGRFEGGTQ